jgi:hypothetical protein
MAEVEKKNLFKNMADPGTDRQTQTCEAGMPRRGASGPRLQLPLFGLAALLVQLAGADVQSGNDGSSRQLRVLDDAPQVAGAIYSLSTPPPFRFDHAMASLGQTMYLFGGQTVRNGQEVVLSDGLWKFDASELQWVSEPLDGVAPPERSQHMLIVQARPGASGRILLLGGFRLDEQNQNEKRCCSVSKKWFTDVWAYNLSSKQWTNPLKMPDSRWGCSGTGETCSRTGPAFSNIKFVGIGDDAVLSFGGYDDQGGACEDETWVLNTSTWVWGKFELKEQTKPPPRYWHSMAWVNSTATAPDQPRGLLVVFGGHCTGSDKDLGDTWLLSLTRQRWEQVISESATPSPRKNHNMVSHDCWVYMHGGDDSGDGGLNDLWRFDVQTKVWREMNSPSAALTNRHNFAMAASSSGMIYFHGGRLGTDAKSLQNFNNDKMNFIDTALLCDTSSYYAAGAGRCESCRKCPPGYFEGDECSAERDTVCNPCAVCGKDEFVKDPCTSVSETVCGKCADLHCKQTDIAGGAGKTGADLGNGALFREGCGSGSEGVCRPCTSCGATEYLRQSCSAFSNTVCTKCSDLDQECAKLANSSSSSSPRLAEGASWQIWNCGNGNRGECVTISVDESPAKKEEPVWLIVLLVVLIGVLTCIMCALAVHMRRWLRKKKRQAEQNRVQRFEVPSTEDLEKVDLEHGRSPSSITLKSPFPGQVQDSTGGHIASVDTTAGDLDDLGQHRKDAGQTSAGVDVLGDLDVSWRGREERSPDAAGTGLSSVDSSALHLSQNRRPSSARRPPTANKPPGIVVTSPQTPSIATSPRSAGSKQEILLLQSTGRPVSDSMGRQGRPRRKVMLASSNRRLDTDFDKQAVSALDFGEDEAHGAIGGGASKRDEGNGEDKGSVVNSDDEFDFDIGEQIQNGSGTMGPTMKEVVEISSAPSYNMSTVSERGEIGWGEAGARSVTRSSLVSSLPAIPSSRLPTQGTRSLARLANGLEEALASETIDEDDIAATSTAAQTTPKASSLPSSSPKDTPAPLSPAMAQVWSFANRVERLFIIIIIGGLDTVMDAKRKTVEGERERGSEGARERGSESEKARARARESAREQASARARENV